MLGYVRESYSDSAKAALALPFVFALAVVCEMIQHVIEVRIGMFASVEAMQAVGDHPARLGFGQVKILALVLVLYWTSRWVAWRGVPGRAVLGDRRSAALFSGVVLFGLVVGVLQHFGSQLLSPVVSDANALVAIGSIFFLAIVALEIYLSAWKVGSALGNASLSIPASFRVIHGNFWWSLGFSLAMTLPLMIVHYGLNTLALAREPALLWSILAVDSVVVGYLGFVLAVTTFLIARRATERSGVPLAPAG